MPSSLTIAPCEWVSFSITVSSEIQIDEHTTEVRPGDWDTCRVTGLPNCYDEDTSLHAVVIASSGTAAEGCLWQPPQDAPVPATYTVQVKVFNDPTAPGYRADRKDSNSTHNYTITVQWPALSVHITEPACEGASVETAAKYYYGESQYDNGGTMETHTVAQVMLAAEATLDCAADSATWTAAPAAAGQARRWFNRNAAGQYTESPAPKGRDVMLWYDGAPADNAGFGERWASVDCHGAHDSHTKHHFYLYFDPEGTMHPTLMAGESPSARWPDWCFYWPKTSAGADQPAFKYNAGLPNPWGMTMFPGNPADPMGTIYLGPGVLAGYQENRDVPYNGMSWQGIDLYANAIRHEAVHRASYLEWWPNGYTPATLDPLLWYLNPPGGVAMDADWPQGDKIPSRVEETVSDDPSLSSYLQSLNMDAAGFPVAKVLRWDRRDTDGDDVDDEEEYTQAIQLRDHPWNPGDADDEDWSWGGHHCPQENCPAAEGH